MGFEVRRSLNPQRKSVIATNRAAREAKEKFILSAGEALEVGHLALHFLAGGVGGGANPLNAQLEFVGVGGAREGFIEGDELLRVEVEERLVEGLHAVLAGASGDGVVDQARFV